MRGCINLILLTIIFAYRVWNPKEGDDIGRWMDVCLCILITMSHYVQFSLKL